MIDQHSGCRHDSKDPFVGIPEYIQWLRDNGRDPMSLISIPSDGLDVDLATRIYHAHKKDIRLSFGIGTNLTNNTKGTWPRPMKQGESPF